MEIPKPGNNERYFANRIEEDPESLIKDEVLIKECNAPIAAKFAIEVLATQKDNKTQEVVDVEIKFVLCGRPGATKDSRETSQMVPEDLPSEAVLLILG